jgi:hypothetical protein
VDLSDDQARRHHYTFTLEGLAEALAMLQCGSGSGGG